MTTQTLSEQAAGQITDGTIIGSVEYYLVLGAIVFVVSAIGAYVGGYLRERGKNFATSADIDKLADAQRRTTSATEEIRAEIHHRFGEEQAIKALYREKIEETLHLLAKLEQWASDAENEAATGTLKILASSPIYQLEGLVALYFPKTESAFLAVRTAYANRDQHILDTVKAGRLSDFEEAKEEFDGLMELYGDRFTACKSSISDFRELLIDKYARTVGIDLPPLDSAHS